MLISISHQLSNIRFCVFCEEQECARRQFARYMFHLSPTLPTSCGWTGEGVA